MSTAQKSRMHTLVSTTLVTFVVVAGLVAVAFFRNRSRPTDDDEGQNKKVDTDNEEQITISVDNKMRSSMATGGESPRKKQETLPELVNRRQYVTSARDKFEYNLGSSQFKGVSNDAHPDAAQGSDTLVEPSLPTNRKKSGRVNNLNTFMSQCASNIERIQYTPCNKEDKSGKL